MTQYAYQLYSSRNFVPWPDTFSMLAEAGYQAVEGYGALYDDSASLAEQLKAAGLSMPSGHVSLEALESDQGAVLSLVENLGIKSVYCPYLEDSQRPTDAAGYRALGGRLADAGRFLIDAGIGFGWHNHDFEFLPLADGSIPMQSLFEGGPDLEWEADIAWIVRAGADPVEWLEREKHRISAVHIKDIAAPGENLDEGGWADVGHGTLDWKLLLDEVNKLSVSHKIVEHDEPLDATRFARRSIAFLDALG